MVSENQPVQPAPSTARTSQGASSGFLMIGAAVIVAGHVLFGIIMGDFTYSTVYVAVSLLILMSILAPNLRVGGTGTQRILGYFLGLAGLLLLLSDARFGFPDGFVDNLANLVFYGGAALAFIGALGLKD